MVLNLNLEKELTLFLFVNFHPITKSNFLLPNLSFPELVTK